MSEHKKQILRESVFLIPFLLIAAVVSVAVMFGTGRNVMDIVETAQSSLTPSAQLDLADFAGDSGSASSLKYYYGNYGNDGETVKYAEFREKADSNEPTVSLTLYEPRDGFDAGYYKTEWFHSEEYITYAPPDDKNNAESYPIGEQPYMYEYVKSYSYENLLNNYGALTEYSNGYSILNAVKLFVWNTDGRTNMMWGIGSIPMQFYTYYNNSDEYKKVTIG